MLSGLPTPKPTFPPAMREVPKSSVTPPTSPSSRPRPSNQWIEPVATIGSFDGIHIGHQALFAALKKEAKAKNLASTVVLFEPQPREFFQPSQAPARLLNLRDKIHILADLGIDQVVCLPFNTSLAVLSADEFIKRILVKGLQVQSLIVGDDFRFGAHRLGDFDLLVEAGRRYGFEVAASETIAYDSRRVSSTWLREAVQRGDFELAAQLVKRFYAISGRVRHGQQRGRQIGIPTMNILLRRPMAVSGVYVVEVHGLGQPYQGVANVGVRPTVDGFRRLLEVHLFDFNQAVYGRLIEVRFLHHLRFEQKFDDIGALVKQIQQDIAEAKQFLRQT